MWFGVLLVCIMPTDVTTCEVKLNAQEKYLTLEECQQNMIGTAKYAASALGLTARPYCFKIQQSI